MFTRTEAQQWRLDSHNNRRRAYDEAIELLDEIQQQAFESLAASNEQKAEAIEKAYYEFLERLSKQRQQVETFTTTTQQAA
jgi:phosphoglycolate phosphatase-like HAD superfamily hydrolase